MKNFYEAQRDVEMSVSCVYYPNGSVDIHFHKSVEILFVTAKRLTVFIGENKVELTENQIILIPSLHPHRIPEGEENTYYTLIVSPPYLKDYNAEKSHKIPLVLGEDNALLPIFKQLMRLPDSRTLVQGLVDVILGNFISYGVPAGDNYKNNNFIINVMDYISERFSSNVTLDEISAHFGYSKYHFSRLFNRNFNCSLRAYVNRLRAEMVQNSAKSGSVMQTIYESGFNTPSSYYRTVGRNITKS